MEHNGFGLMALILGQMDSQQAFKHYFTQIVLKINLLSALALTMFLQLISTELRWELVATGA